MPLRPMFNANISFGLVSVPVRFYTATKSEDVHFHMLHQSCGTRVNRKWWCPHHEKIVSSDELVRGYEIRKNKYVTVTDEELEALQTDDDRAVEITEFLPLDLIDPVFFEKAWFLGPAAGGAKTYKLLADAMKRQGKIALASWVYGGREHLVILRSYENGLILHTMYYADEVRDFGVERIKAKSHGKSIISEEPEKEKGGGEVIDIMDALQRSLQRGAATRSTAHARRSGHSVVRMKRGMKRRATTRSRKATTGAGKRKAS